MSLPRKERVIEVPLSDGTLKQLVEQHLDSIGAIRYNEAIIRMDIGQPDKKGIRKISFMFIEEREAQVIVHR